MIQACALTAASVCMHVIDMSTPTGTRGSSVPATYMLVRESA